MRILTVIMDLGMGGTQRAARNFTHAYARSGHEVAVLAYRGGGAHARDLEQVGIPIFLGKENDNAELTRALTQARQFEAEIIHIHRWGSPDPISGQILRELKKERTRILETNVFSLTDCTSEGQLIDVHLQLSEWCLWKWWREARQLTPVPVGCVLPYLVDCESFFPAGLTSRTTFRAKHGIPESAFVFGRTGQPAAGKWSSSVFDAFLEIAGLQPHVHLLLVGLPESLRSALDDLPIDVRARVHVLSALEGDNALRECYSAMDVFVHHANIGESFGMVLAEAMLCELPVITVSTPRADNSQLEVVKHQQGGLVVSHPRLLSRAMRTLLEDNALRTRLSKTSPSLIHSRFSASTLIPSALKIAEAALFSNSREELRKRLAELSDTVTIVSDSRISQLLKASMGETRVRDRLFVNYPGIYRWISDALARLRSPLSPKIFSTARTTERKSANL